MSSSALVLVFLCLVCTHFCDRLKRKKTFGERLTPSRPQLSKRLAEALPQMRNLAQAAVEKAATTKARVSAGLAAAIAEEPIAKGVFVGLAGGAAIGSFRYQSQKPRQQVRDIEEGARLLGFRLSDDETSHRTSPSIVIGSRDSRQLLQKWADFVKSPETRQNADVCARLRNLVASVDRQPSLSFMMNRLEMVGMVSKASLQSGSSAVALESLGALDVSVTALGVFVRETFEDDQRGSLRQQIEEHYENGQRFTRGWFGRPKKQLDVFTIEGLADAPSEASARLLMSKIAKYASDEQKVVVVPERAYKSVGGAELLSYYERLGFKKIELQEMEQTVGDAPAKPEKVDAQGRVWWRPGPHVLLYLGDPLAINKVGNDPMGTKKMPQDEPADNQQMMIGIKLWTGL